MNNVNTTTIPSLINKFIKITYKLHSKLLTINDGMENSLSDKQLHFLIVGLMGVGLMIVIGPIFKYLAKRHLTILITWFYVLNVLIVATFALEIAQGYSGTGFMDFNDIISGIKGYLFMSGILIGIYAFIQLIIYLIKRSKNKNSI